VGQRFEAVLRGGAPVAPCRLVPRNAVVALSIVALLLLARREAAACISGPGNGNEESGDCLNDAGIDFGPKGNLLYLMIFTTAPALAFDFNAMAVGARRVSKGLKIAGIIGGSLTLALTAGYVSVAGVGSDDGLAVGIAGAAIGAPALIGGIVGLAAPKDDDGGPIAGLVRCAAPGFHGSRPVPRVAHQSGGTSVVMSLVDGRW